MLLHMQYVSLFLSVFCAAASSLPYNVTVPGTSLSSISPSPPSATLGAPSPTQLGISPSCNKYSLAPKGDTCTALSIANDNRISKELLYAWNDVLGNNGQNCVANYWAGYWYCVGVNPAPLGGNPDPSTLSARTRHVLPPIPRSESQRSRKRRMTV